MTKPHKYTDEQIEFLEINCKGIQYKKLARMFNERFKTNLTRNAIAVKCQRLGFKNGVDKTFQKGNKLWNKGMTGYMGPNKTSFKKGNIPESWVPVGSETHRTDGYLKIKIAEPNVWKLKHHYVWEKHHGKIPAGHNVIFLDNDRNNVEISNLALIEKKEHLTMNRHKLHSCNAEVTKTGIVIAKIKNAIHKKKQELK